MTPAAEPVDTPRRDLVLKAIREVCDYRDWSLLAAHVRSNHVYVVVHALIQPEFVMNDIKRMQAVGSMNVDLMPLFGNAGPVTEARDVYGNPNKSKRRFSTLCISKESQWQYLSRKNDNYWEKTEPRP